jgi:demethylmenaquinone methyltransferase/2-methoxy-6-polyprenyl-1,4-benzoquinol methylase
LPRYFADEQTQRHFLRELFDGTARDYDFVERLLALGSGPWYRRKALLRAGLAPGMQVLDVAIGTGLVAREALGIVGPKGSIVGIDPSGGMLAEARRQLPVSLIAARGEKLPLRNASFDFVSMGFALRHVADLDSLFREFRRVLKPGGTVCVLEISRPRSKAVAAWMRMFMTRVVPGIATVARKRRDARRLMQFYWDTIDACVAPEEVLAALVRCGLGSPERTLILGMFSEYVAKRSPLPLGKEP